jgi:predicted enzyme related to lactoylglutathione lyase
MAVVFSELIVDARDVELVAAFWEQVLGWRRTGRYDEDGEIELAGPPGSRPTLLFVPVPEKKAVKNRLHIDVSPAAGSDQSTELARLVALGATPVDVGPGEAAGCTWVVLADPEGNEFCLLRDPVD